MTEAYEGITVRTPHAPNLGTVLSL
jgi:hypothetical protein